MKNSISVLLIDDDTADIRLIQALLAKSRHSRFTVNACTKVNDALFHLSADKHDIYLVDYFLGDTNGLDLIQEARRLECQTPIVVITGAESEDIDESVMNAGAADYLPKDELSTSLLERTIKHALERNRYIQQLEFLANRDPLTNLANRSMFEDLLEQQIALSQRRNLQFAVLLLDLDRFKEVNDTLGHSVGDALLTLVANRLKNIMRKEDVIARIGGDEFAILLSMHEIIDIASICEKILYVLKQPSPINENKLVISTSIGVALFPQNGETTMSLMVNADMALYKAKAMGKNNFQFFNEELHKKLILETDIEKGIREGLAKDQFFLHYQPQFELCSGRITGFEALVRWQNPNNGLISPAEFIPVAEKTGLILELGDWITEAACKQLKNWHDQGFKELKMAINMSPKQIRKQHFFEHLVGLLEHFQLPPESIELEVTESIFVDANALTNVNYFNQLQEMGISLAIDDFGTGYSSFSYIKSLPVNKLKIDRSFISGDMISDGGHFISQAIITLGRGLNKIVVAEGIETEEQAELLLEQGCHLGQGYWFSRPVTAIQATDMLKQSYRKMLNVKPE